MVFNFSNECSLSLSQAWSFKTNLSYPGEEIKGTSHKPNFYTFQEVTGKNVMLLPMGACDDGAHSQNEKINIRNYIEGVSTMVVKKKMLIILCRNVPVPVDTV